MKGVSILAAVVAIAVIIVMGFFAAIFILSASYERTLSDRVASAHAAINLFYAYNETLPMFTNLIVITTAKDLGENCGGVDCGEKCVWNNSCPTLEQLTDKYKSVFENNFYILPKNIGELGKFNFTQPSIKKIEFDENHINLTLKYHTVSLNLSGFAVNATNEKDLEISENIRYYLLLEIGKMLFKNGTYPITWDGTKTIRFESGSSNNTFYNKCKDLHDNYPIKISNYQINIPVDNFLELAIECGIDGTEGLASISDFYGEVTKLGSYDVDCTRREALQATDYNWIDNKINNVIDKIKRILGEIYPDLNFEISVEIQDGDTSCGDGKFCYSTNLEKPPPFTDNNCEMCNSYCTPGTCTKGGNSCSCSFDECVRGDCDGDCSCGVNERNGVWETREVTEKWDDSKSYYWIDVYQMNYFYDCDSTGQDCDCDTCYDDEGNPYPCNCKTLYVNGDDASYFYYCEYKENFKFYAKPVVEIEMEDSSILIPIKDSTNFEPLKLKLKFKGDYEIKPS